ncbi:MAG: hypothetical protein IPJ30_00245 [Acidobacteria bacterium]|nr:hypothetical protein [Acidobacteriota bacterium]MBK8149725.1 hypothetical protein [Acidobacteriota bacterium]
MTSKNRKSKKRSITKNPVEQLSDVVFFLDRSTGKQLAAELRRLGLTVETHDEHFEQNALDIEWLARCGRMRWVVISSDRAIKSNSLEKRILFENGVAAFFFTSANLTSGQQFEIFSKALRRVASLIINETRPFIARIGKNGSTELWLDHRGDDRIAKRQIRQAS